MKRQGIETADLKIGGLRRVLGMKYALSVGVLITIVAWLSLTVIYGYLWVDNVFNTETLYGYERSRLLISTAFIAYKLPYLLIALIVMIVSELVLIFLVKRHE